MANDERKPKGKRTDRRVLIAAALVAAIVLALFLLSGFHYPAAEAGPAMPEDAYGTPAQDALLGKPPKEE